MCCTYVGTGHDFVIYSKGNKAKPVTKVSRWAFTIFQNLFLNSKRNPISALQDLVYIA